MRSHQKLECFIRFACFVCWNDIALLAWYTLEGALSSLMCLLEVLRYIVMIELVADITVCVSGTIHVCLVSNIVCFPRYREGNKNDGSPFNQITGAEFIYCDSINAWGAKKEIVD